MTENPQFGTDASNLPSNLNVEESEKGVLRKFLRISENAEAQNDEVHLTVPLQETGMTHVGNVQVSDVDHTHRGGYCVNEPKETGLHDIPPRSDVIVVNAINKISK